MKKVLLLQRKYTDNLGDVAIGKSMCYLLENHNCNVYHHEFCSLSKTNVINTSAIIENDKIDPQRPSSFERLPSIVRKYYWLFLHRNLFKDMVFRNFDRVIIGGGELVQGGNFGYALYWWTRLLKLFHRNTEIFLFSVGVFDQWKVYDKKLVDKALNKINGVYVRDEKSAENLINLFDKKSKVVPDSVFANPVEVGVGSQNNHVIYGITPFSRFLFHDKIALYTDKNTFYEKCHNDIQIYLESGKKVSLFYTTKADLNSCISFNQYCIEKYGISYPIDPIRSLNDLISVIKDSDIVVSARMHACILAVLFSKKVCPIVLSEKMKSFVKRYMNLKENDFREFAISLNSAISEVLEE